MFRGFLGRIACLLLFLARRTLFYRIYNHFIMEQIELTRRFGGLDRLFGPGSYDYLAQGRVVIAGLGGVGSWCAEALARSGVGGLTLIDMDHVSTSNINRQLPALSSTVGRSKIQVLAERIEEINPRCQVRLVDDFVDAENAALWFGQSNHVFIDCTDMLAAKVALALAAKKHPQTRLLVCGAAGGKRNPLSLSEGDLARATYDALLASMRQQLRKHHGWPPGGGSGGKKAPPMNIHAFWFAEETVLPPAWSQEDDSLQGLSCSGYGSAVTLTASMGLLAAQRAIDILLARS